MSLLLAVQGPQMLRLTICACIRRALVQFLYEVFHSDLEISPVVYISDGWVLDGGVRENPWGDEDGSL